MLYRIYPSTLNIGGIVKSDFNQCGNQVYVLGSILLFDYVDQYEN
jgi:hypothetical protein